MEPVGLAFTPQAEDGHWGGNNVLCWLGRRVRRLGRLLSAATAEDAPLTMLVAPLCPADSSSQLRHMCDLT